MKEIFVEVKFLVVVAFLIAMGLIFLYLIYTAGAGEESIDNKISSCLKTATYGEKNFCFSDGCPDEVTTQDAIYCLEDLAKHTAAENKAYAEKVCDTIGEIIDSVYGEDSMISGLYKDRCQEFIS